MAHDHPVQVCRFQLIERAPFLQTNLSVPFFFFIYHDDYSVVKGQNPIVDIAEGGNMGLLPPSEQWRYVIRYIGMACVLVVVCV